MPGVIAVIDERDLPGSRNMVGVTPVKDDYVFAREKVFDITFISFLLFLFFNSLVSVIVALFIISFHRSL